MTPLTARDVEKTELDMLREVVLRLPANSHLSGALTRFVDDIGSGADVVLAPIDEELTPNEAARLLGMSRPHLYKLLDRGVVPSNRVGRDRRILLADVMRYRELREVARRDLAETFAHADRTANALTARLAGVDEETARELGYQC